MMKIVASLLLAFLLIGCAQENYRAEKEYWKAEKLLQQISKADFEAKGPEVFAPAIQAFEQVIEKYPASVKSLDSMFVVSNLYIKQRNFPMARKTLERAVSNFGQYENRVAEARYGIAQLYENEKNWEAAEKAYWELAEFHPLHPKGLFAPTHMMIHYKRLGDISGFEKIFSRTLDHFSGIEKKMGPIDPIGLVRIHHGTAYMTRGDWREARDMWLSVPKDFPKNPFAATAVMAAAEVSLNKGEVEKALELYHKIIADYPKSPLVSRVHIQIGHLYQQQKKFAEARKSYEAVLNSFPEDAIERAEVYFVIAQSYQYEGNWTEAEKMYQNIEAKYPKSLSALKVPLMIAMHHEANQDSVEAVKELDEAIQSYMKIKEESDDPMQDAYIDRLEQLAYARKGEWDKVILGFDENMQKETILIRKGNWLLLKAIVTEQKLKNVDQAKLLYQSFLEQYPTHPLVAMAQRQLGALNTPPTTATTATTA